MSRLQKTFWFALLIKMALAAILPLTNDEAYYWVWAQHMQLSYFDHPPFVAWLFWLGERINVFGSVVRWPGILLGQATLAIWLVVLRPYLSDSQRLVWLLLALLSPLVGGTNLIVTPDLPLLFCNALALWVFLQWRERGTWWWALGLGGAIGLGFSAKYVMVLFPLSLLPLILFSPTIRTLFFKHLGWIVLGVVAGSFPVWLWNILNDFASFRFQAQHGLGRSWKPSWTIEYVAAQLGLIFPIIFYWALRARRKMPAVFHFLAWVPLGFFFLTTTRGYVESNWPIVAHPALLALAVASYPKNVRGLQWTAAIWGVLLAALATVILLQPPWAVTTKFREFHEFDRLSVAAQGLEPMYARSYQMAAKMHFQMHRTVNKLRGMNRLDFYDFLPESEPTANLYYLAVQKDDALPLYFSSRGHTIVEKIPVDDTFEIWKIAVKP